MLSLPLIHAPLCLHRSADDELAARLAALKAPLPSDEELASRLAALQSGPAVPPPRAEPACGWLPARQQSAGAPIEATDAKISDLIGACAGSCGGASSGIDEAEVAPSGSSSSSIGWGAGASPDDAALVSLAASGGHALSGSRPRGGRVQTCERSRCRSSPVQTGCPGGGAKPLAAAVCSVASRCLACR